MAEMPKIVRVDGRPRLLVDGKPFLILGLQWACESCFSKKEMNPLFAEAARMGANTAVLPLYWREIEPEPDRFDFAMLDERLAQCRKNGLRLVLLWFATWKNAHHGYAPDYIQNDPQRFPLALNREGKPAGKGSLCPSSEVTWQRDRQALVAVMEHLRRVDEERTVILFQVENEPGIMGSDRCYCPTCEAKFRAGGYEARFGPRAAEAFSVVSIATYIDRLAAEAKAVYPLPMYQNVWLATFGGMPGRNYPSGGAVQHMLGLALEHTKHLDLLGPDIYMHGYRQFHSLCQTYATANNPLYIVEHSSSPTGRAERNVFYAIGQHGAIGFDPWAIDSPFPERDVPPPVDPIGQEWAPQAYALRDSYVAIGRAIQPIVEAQGTDRLFTFVQEPGETWAGWAAKGCDLVIHYISREGAGRGMAIQLGENEFLLLGTGFRVTFQRPYPDGTPRREKSVVKGEYVGDRWVPLHLMEGKHAYFLEPGVARVELEPEGGC